MAYFSELNISINEIISRVLNNQDLCKYLYYNEPDPLSKTDISDTSTLLLNNIFPLPKEPDAETDKISLLNVYFYSGKIGDLNKGFKCEYLVFDIICHLDIWMVKNGIRPYYISNKIDEIFNNKHIPLLGINKPIFDYWICKKYSNYFYGFNLMYKLYNNSNMS